MKPWTSWVVWTLLLTLALSSPARGQDAAAARDAAFAKFLDTRTPADAARAVDAVLAARVGYEEALKRLKEGRPYAAQKPGVVMLTNKTEDKVEHYYAVTVPPAYDPAKRYQVRFQLHGGVMGRSTNQPRNSGEIGALAGADQFYVIPYGWSDAPWWSEDQVLNMNAIVDSLKRTYNIDENRVVVSGVSDGGTGAYYLAMRETTPFASFLPLNGFIMVLANIDTGIRDQLYPEQPPQQTVLRRERRTRSPVSHRGGRAVRPAPEESRRQRRLSPAAARRAQHGVVAGHQGIVRAVRAPITRATRRRRG